MKEKKYTCTHCGALFTKWSGKCEVCKNWNSISSVIGVDDVFVKDFVSISNIEIDKNERFISGVSEFDRVTGGGIVKGSVILLAGEPGIGKSTLLLKALNGFAKNGLVCDYITSEESVQQIAARARRTSNIHDNIRVAQGYSLEDILTKTNGDIIVVDSIQAVYHTKCEGVAGSINQVRFCTNVLIEHARSYNKSIIMTGHVTKEGSIAGPKFTEHMVDAVFIFEHGYNLPTLRLLRGQKNRYGSCEEIGMFDMQETGIMEISTHTLNNVIHGRQEVGTSIFPCMESGRPSLIEIQALISKTIYNLPKRASVGLDHNRVAMVIAVIEAKTNINFANNDIHVNAVSGIRVSEPAADLAIAVAIISAMMKKKIDEQAIIFGEVSLTGSIRSVNMYNNRILEARNFGISKIIMPKEDIENQKDIMFVTKLSDIIKCFNT